MSDITIVVLFNGTDQSDINPILSNIVKMRDGLVEDTKQLVIYEDGIGNIKDWKSTIIRWISLITGYGGKWVMDEAYQSLISKIKQNIQQGLIKDGDNLKLSVGGFSRGAALARHFATQYLQAKLSYDLYKQTQLKLDVELKAEYLFDTVPSFGLPINIWFLKLFGIYTQQRDPR